MAMCPRGLAGIIEHTLTHAPGRIAIRPYDSCAATVLPMSSSAGPRKLQSRLDCTAYVRYTRESPILVRRNPMPRPPQPSARLESPSAISPFISTHRPHATLCNRMQHTKKRAALLQPSSCNTLQRFATSKRIASDDPNIMHQHRR